LTAFESALQFILNLKMVDLKLSEAEIS